MTTHQRIHFRPAVARAAVLAALSLSPGLWPSSPLWAVSRTPDGENYRGEAAYYSGNFSQAESEYRRYLAAHTNDQATALDLAAVLMEDGQSDEAARVLEQRGLHGYELGEAYLAAGDFKKATVELITSLRQSGPQWRAHMLLGLIASLQSRHAEAVEYYWQALNEDVRQPTVHLLLARSLAALGQDSPNAREYFRQRAREEYLRALRTDPSLWQVHGDLASLNEDEGNYRAALKEWDRVRDVIGRAPWVEEAIARVAKLAPGAPPATPTVAATPEPAEGAIPAVRRPVYTDSLRDIRVQPLSQTDDPIIRVGLADRMSTLSFGSAGGWVAQDRKGRRFWEGVGGRGYRLVADRRGRWTLRNWDGKIFKRVTKPLVIEPINKTQVMGVFNLYQSSGYFWGGGWRATRYYRGRLLVIPQGKQLQLINLVPLEDYLASVVPAEMPANWPCEALKAQAVAARSDTLSRRYTHEHQGYDVCPTPHCCQYDGVASEDPRAQEAIVATAGQVLYRNGQLVPTFYSHACGGVTQDFEDAWGHGHDLFSDSYAVLDTLVNTPLSRCLPFAPHQVRSFLTTQPEVLCADARYSGKSSFRWIKVLNREEADALLSERFQIGGIREIRVEERSRSSYVRAVYIEGDQGHATVRGDHIRTLLGGLRSNLFVILPIMAADRQEPLAWVVWGGGWGHGVGFCQSGAAAMGDKGYACAEILLHYFPGSNLYAVPWRRQQDKATQTAQDRDSRKRAEDNSDN